MHYQKQMKKLVSRYSDTLVGPSNAFTIDERFTESVKRFYNAYTKRLCMQTFYNDYTSVEWSCYECKCPIHVPIVDILNNKKFKSTSLFCDKHKPTDYSQLSTYVFLRYENSFFGMIKNKILLKTFDNL